MIEKILFFKKGKFLNNKHKITNIHFLFSPLLLLPLFLVLISSILIESIQRQSVNNDSINHITTGLIGYLLAILISYIPLERIRKYVFPIYIFSLISLILIYFFGISIYGAQRWLSLGFFSFQPSEIAKLSTLLVLSVLLEKKSIILQRNLFIPTLFVIIPWVLIFFQPDLGTSLVLVFLFLVMLYWSHIPIEWILIIVFCLITSIVSIISLYALIPWIVFMGFLAYRSFYRKKLFIFLTISLHSLVARLTPILWNVGLKGYQKDRLILFLDPSKDPLGGGYHLLQSQIAVGSGGMIGTGLLQGKLTNLNFIPEQHTDFIFSALGEELGFLGSFFVVTIFFILIMKLISISKNARTDFESLVVIGIASIFLFQIIINIYMTIGLGPVTGIPLPFMSYGRTSLLINFVFIGLALSVLKRCRSLRKI